MLEFLTGFQDIALLFSRIFLGALFMVHGKPKMLGPKPGIDGFSDYLESMNFPVPKLMAFIAAVVEFWGGLALILGVLVKPIAVLMAVLILVAMYVNIESGKDFKGGWEVDLLILAVCLVIMTFGAGDYTIVALF